MKKQSKFLLWFANPKWYFLLPVILVAIAATACGTVILTQDALSEYIIWGYVCMGIMSVTLSYSVYGVIRLYPRAKERSLRNTAVFTAYMSVACNIANGTGGGIVRA